VVVGDIIVFDDGGVEFAEFFVVFGRIEFGYLWLFSNDGFPCDDRVLDRTFYSQSMKETVEEQMASKSTAMLVNLNLGIVGEGVF